MKISKLQDFFSESFVGIVLIRRSTDCMWSKHQMSKSALTTRSIANTEKIITKS